MDLEAGAYYFEQIYEILQRKLKKMPESWEPVKLSGCEVVRLSSLILGTLNNFNFHVYAQKCQVVRLTSCQVVKLSRCQVVKFDPWDNFCFHV